MKGGHPFCDAATILDLQDLTLTLATDEVQKVQHRHQGEGGVEFRRRRVLFRALICAVKGPGLSINYNAAPCGGFLLPTCTPSFAKVSEAPGTSSATTTSSGGGGGGDAHKSNRSLPSFFGSDMSRHLRQVNDERAEVMEGLLTLF